MIYETTKDIIRPRLEITATEESVTTKDANSKSNPIIPLCTWNNVDSAYNEDTDSEDEISMHGPVSTTKVVASKLEKTPLPVPSLFISNVDTVYNEDTDDEAVMKMNGIKTEEVDARGKRRRRNRWRGYCKGPCLIFECFK